MNLIKYLKLYIGHYVDDAVLVAKSAEDIHFFDVISVYCEQWELNVNVLIRGTREIPTFNFS